MKIFNMKNKSTYAIRSRPYQGPVFGDCDFKIKEDMKCGETFANDSCNYLSNFDLELIGEKGGHKDFETEELEVFKVLY